MNEVMGYKLEKNEKVVKYSKVYKKGNSETHVFLTNLRAIRVDTRKGRTPFQDIDIEDIHRVRVGYVPPSE